MRHVEIDIFFYLFKGAFKADQFSCIDYCILMTKRLVHWKQSFNKIEKTKNEIMQVSPQPTIVPC